MRSLADTASTLRGVSLCFGSFKYVMTQTIVDIYASAASITGTAASPFLTTALLPHRNSSDSGSEYRGRCEELLHGYRIVAEIRFLRRSLVKKQILRCCTISLYKCVVAISRRRRGCVQFRAVGPRLLRRKTDSLVLRSFKNTT